MKRYAVIGHPVEHSLSPQIHQYFARHAGIELSYQKLLSPLAEFNHYARTFFDQGGCGVNITLPFKGEAFLLASEHSSAASAAKSANTLKKLDNGALFADNTDGIGFVRDVSENLAYQIEDKQVLILGAGGAVSGILLPLLQQKPKQVLIANRTQDKAKQLAQRFKNEGELCGFSLSEIKNKAVDIVINATSASVVGEALILPDNVAEGALCYDLFYGAKTPFMKWAEKKGAQLVTDGLGMLVEQAAAAFYLWHGVRVETGGLIDTLRRQNA